MENISLDTPLRLRDAVKAAFPAGGMTVSGLRREIARGRLEAELIANKHFVTLAGIARMRERCLVARPSTQMQNPVIRGSTWKSGAQAALAARLEALKEESRAKKRKTQPVGQPVGKKK